MNAIYLDIFSGISGDMFLGAMIDLGVEVGKINEALNKIQIGDVKIETTRKVKNGICGIKVEVIECFKERNTSHIHDFAVPHSESKNDHYHHRHHEHQREHEELHKNSHQEHDHHSAESHHESRTFKEIATLIETSKLSDWVKEKSLNIFSRIARAEAKIHGKKVEEVHFHEVGAIDSIVDIIGACVALEELGKPAVFCAPVVEGKGFVHCAHGNFPVPAPATLEILSERNIPITQCDEPGELVTPTGAALIAEFAEDFTSMQEIKPIKIGYGLGSREGKTRPNVLRAVLCEFQKEDTLKHDWETDRVAIIETNLDDINSEVLGHFIEKALSAGALDVYYSNVLMKKNRPGVVLHLMCESSRIAEFARMILSETTAFGVRVHEFHRFKLKRKFTSVKTEYGEIRIKEGYLDGRKIQSAPEYEDCKAAALKHGAPLKQVYEVALSQYIKSQGG